MPVGDSVGVRVADNDEGEEGGELHKKDGGGEHRNKRGKLGGWERGGEEMVGGNGIGDPRIGGFGMLV